LGTSSTLGDAVHCTLAQETRAVSEVTVSVGRRVGGTLAVALGALDVTRLGIADGAKTGALLGKAVGTELCAALGTWDTTRVGDKVGSALGSFVGRISLHTQTCSVLRPHLDALEQLLEFSSTVQSLAP